MLEEHFFNCHGLFGLVRIAMTTTVKRGNTCKSLLEVELGNVLSGVIHVSLAAREFLLLGLTNLIVLFNNSIVLGLKLGLLGCFLFSLDGLTSQTLLRGQTLEFFVKLSLGCGPNIKLFGRGHCCHRSFLLIPSNLNELLGFRSFAYDYIISPEAL